MNILFILIIFLGSLSFNCFGSASLNGSAKISNNIYPIPRIPQQTNVFNPGQSYRNTLQEAGSYVLPSVGTIAKGFIAHKDDGISGMARAVGKTIRTSLSTLVDYEAMKGDTSKSVSQLIQEGKLIAAIEHDKVLKKSATQSYEAKAYTEIQTVLQQLREHDDLIQRELCTIQERKIRRSRELLTKLFLTIEALESGMFGNVHNESTGCGSWTNLFLEIQTVLGTIAQSNEIFLYTISAEINSFNAIIEPIEQNLANLEAKMKRHSTALAAVASSFEQAITRH